MVHILKKIYHKIFLKDNKPSFPDSQDYWEMRYSSGGNSGSGSYNHLANFKAEIINNFIKEKRVNSVIEFGCGDGNQLRLIKYPAYIGLDVSKAAIKLCSQIFKNDPTKSFFLYDSLCFVDKANIFRAEVSLSLDVIYHILEDEIYDTYMNHLFSSASDYVIIYSSNYESKQEFHERNREFTKWVNNHTQNWELIEKLDNKYPESKEDVDGTSKADFYIFKKQI